MRQLPAGLRELFDTARHKQIDKDQILYYQGDSMEDSLYLVEGLVKLYDIDAAGNEKILHIFKSPALIPLALFSGTNSKTRWFYAALTDCEVAVIPRTELDALLAHDAAAVLSLTNWFSSEMHEVLTRLNSLSKTKTRDKLIAALKYLATCHRHTARGKWCQVTFPVTHQLLADLTGISRESVTAALHDLQTEKIIKITAQSTLQINSEKLFKL